MSFRFHIIVGEQNKRKSSVIRALTGIRDYGDIEIQEVSGGTVNLYAKHKSLQEASILPADFLNAHPSTRKYTDILIALRVKPYNNCPDANSYINYLMSNGHYIANIVALGETKATYLQPAKAPNPIYISNSIKIPTNAISQQVRNAFGWM